MSAGASNPDVLHLVEYQKFIPSFIDLVNKELATHRHHFYFIHNGDKYKPGIGAKVTLNDGSQNIVKFLIGIFNEGCRAKKIVLHGLFSFKLTLALTLQPWLWKKCYWVIWGGDLYGPELSERDWRWRLKEILRSVLIPKLGHLLTYVPGDAALAREWYGAKGELHHFIMYPSNVYQKTTSVKECCGGPIFLVGNSADPSNNHAELFDKIKKSGCLPVKLIVPLSYGPKEYASKVAELGARMFGSSFVALRDFVNHDDYLKMLSDVDVAVFNHRRQQGMGNVISLLGMGKTVAIRSDVSSWDCLTSIGITLRDTMKMDFTPLENEFIEKNKSIVSVNFSMEALVQQCRSIFEN